MTRSKVTTSFIVRVVEVRGGERIVLLDLRRNRVHEFRSWAAALRCVRRLSRVDGLQ